MTVREQTGPDDQLAQLGDFAGKLRALPTPELNVETLPHLLNRDRTPTELLFVRNRGRMPKFTPAELQNWKTAIENWTLTIDGRGAKKPGSWTGKEIMQMEPVEVTAVLECAGNGRAFFPGNRLTNYLDSKVAASPFLRATRAVWSKQPWAAGTVMWRDGAVGCVKWTGVPLARLLEDNVRDDAAYTGHHSIDTRLDGTGPAISRGLPILKALAAETLVAWGMNDAFIPPIHGGPLRLVAPGYPGSAWQKWLHRIELCTEEHQGALMDEYRIDGEVIREMPVNSVIVSPADGFAMPAGQPLRVEGFAWSGQAHIAAVSVSADGGLSWAPARLGEQPHSRFSWRRFAAEFSDPAPGPINIVVRAADEAGAEQPLASRRRWGNPIGYCNNVVRRVSGQVR